MEINGIITTYGKIMKSQTAMTMIDEINPKL
jgi:hypothetical protein